MLEKRKIFSNNISICIQEISIIDFYLLIHFGIRKYRIIEICLLVGEGKAASYKEEGLLSWFRVDLELFI